MNRFILDRDPVIAAQQHCDKHVVKMILEEAQMLSTVHRRFGSQDDRLYKATHANHPCTIWAGQTRANYRWAYNLFVALCDEYTHRYGKIHATARLLPALAEAPESLPDGPLTPFAQAMPDELHHEDAVEAYRLYYVVHKSGFAKWSKRDIPLWYIEYEKEINND
jgi:hypothetical protein